MSTLLKLSLILLLLSAAVQAAPTASISCPATALVGEPVICDGSASTNVNGQIGWSTLTFVDGTAPVAWDFGDGLGPYSRAEILRPTHVYLAAGTYTIGLTVKDSAGATASTSTSITISNIAAATGGGIQTLTDQGSGGANCTALQNAINAAFGANTVEQEIRLPVLTYTCALTVPAAAGGKYVTIRPSDVSWLPGPLKRVSSADSANMPKIRSPGVDQAQLTMNGAGRKYLRLLGLEFSKQAGHLYQFIEIGTDAPATFSAIPHHIIVDRCYLHGMTTDGAVRAINYQADSLSVLNSYFEDFHDTGSDTQAIVGFAGTGFGFVNNFAEAYGENIMFGGGDTSVRYSSTANSGGSTTSCTLTSVGDLTIGTPISFVVGGARDPDTATIVRSIAGSTITYDAISGVPDTTAGAVKYGATPADIFIARNYFYKDRFYRVGDVLYNGTYAPVVKNSIEFKHGMRAVLDGNYVEGNWGSQGQSGPTILFTVRNQSNNNPWAVVRDIQFSNTRIKSVPDVFNFLGVDDDGPPPSDTSGPADRAQYIVARNNLVEDLNSTTWSGSYGALVLFGNGPRNITITHNTVINIGSQLVIATGTATSNVLFVNNIGQYRNYGFFGDGGTLGDTAITAYMPDGFFRHNVMSDDISQKGPTGGSWTAPRGAPNYFPATIETGTFIDRAAGNYRLKSDSPYKAGNATPAADGTDIGVNFDDVSTATANTISGNWTGASLCRWHTSPACQ